MNMYSNLKIVYNISMIIGGILIILFSVISWVMGFAIGYGVGYETSEHDKTNNAHEPRGTANPMEQDNTRTNSSDNFSL